MIGKPILGFSTLGKWRLPAPKPPFFGFIGAWEAVIGLKLTRREGCVGRAISLSTRIKDAGIAIRHSRGYIISILQGLEMGWKGRTCCVKGAKIKKKVSQIIKKGVRPKVQNPKMGLPITPRPF